MKERKERITASNPVRRLAALLLAAGAAGSALAEADYINANFYYVNSGNAYTAVTMNNDQSDSNNSDSEGWSSYAVQGKYWNDVNIGSSVAQSVKTYDSSAGSLSESSVTVTISGSRGGYFSAGGFDHHILSGYIDDNANYTSPLVTFANIPFDYYKVVVYFAADGASTRFGYITLNDTVNLYGDGTGTDIGIDADGWGGCAAQVNSQNNFQPGRNILVSPVLKNTASSTLKVQSRSYWPGATATYRSGIAAIQVVKAEAPAACTYTVSEGGTYDLFGSGATSYWSASEPSTGSEAVTISISGDTTLTVNDSRVFASLTVTGSGTLTLAGTGEIVTPSVTVNSGVTLLKTTGQLSTSAAVSVPESSALEIANSCTWSGVISGAGSVKVSANSVTFLAANTYTDGLVVASGGLAKSGNSTGWGSKTVKAVTVQSGGTLDISGAYSTGYNFYIAGTGVDSQGALVNSTPIAYGGSLPGNLTLSADATIDCFNAFGVGGSKSLNLNGHILTIKATSAETAKQFYVHGSFMNGGTTADTGKIVLQSNVQLYSNNGNGISTGQQAILLEAQSGSSVSVGASSGSFPVSNTTIADGAALAVEGTLNLQNGKTLTVNGTANISGTANIGQSGNAGSHLVVGGTVNVNGSGTIKLVSTSNITKNDNGVINIAENAQVWWINCAWTSTAGDIFRGEGTLNLDGNYTHTFSNSGFTGKLKATHSGNFIFDNYPAFTGRPELICNSTAENKGFVISGGYAGNSLNVRNLNGGLSYFTCTYNDPKATRVVDTLQTRDTEFSGKFISEDSASKRKTGLVVRGSAETGVHSLTLTKASTTFGGATVQDYGKLIFSSDGSWANGKVTVANGGYLEVQNTSSVASTLDLQSGGTIKLATATATVNDEEVTTVVGITAGTVEFPDSGKAVIDVSAIPDLATDEEVTIITATTSLDSDIANIRPVGKPYALKVDGNSLKVVNDGGLVWDSTNGWNGKDVTKYGEATITSPGTVALDGTSLAFDTLTIGGSGTVSFSATGDETITVNNIVIGSGVTLDASAALSISAGATISGEGTLDIPVGTTCTMNGVTCSAKVTVEGTLRTTGTTNLSAANTSAANSLIEVVSDTTTLASKVSGIEGNITIAYEAELVAGKCWAPNDDDWYLEPIKPTGTTILDISGTLTLNTYIWYFGAGTTINLRSGASISGTGRSADYGNLSWIGKGTLNCYANTTINAAIRTKADVSPVFNVEDGVTLTIASAFVPQTSTADNFTGSGSITKVGAGTLCLKNVAMTKPISGSEGTLQLLSDASGVKTHTATSSFSGKVIITRNTNGGHHEIGTSSDDDSNPGVFFLSGSPELEINGSAAYLCLNRSFAGKYMTVKNLSATSGTIDAMYTSGGTSKTIKCLQTDDTTYAGNFNGESTTVRFVDLLVYGKNETVKTLTLSGASGTMNSYGTLTVKDYGKVKFSGSGDWAAGTVVVGANGYLESSSSAATLASTLTLQDGATMTFVPDKNVTVTTLNLPSGEGETVTFDINYVPALEGTTLISCASITAETDVSMIQCENAVIKAEEDAIKAYPVATLTYTANEVITTTPYATVADAYTQAYMREAVLNTSYDYIAIYKTSSFSSYTQTVKVKPADGVTVTVTSGSPEYGSYTAGTADENGVFTYTASPAPATYTWVSASQGDWSTVGNWKYSDGDYLQWATRYPQAGDTVIFNDGAAVNHAASVSVAGIVVNGNVTVSGTSSLETSGNVTGSGMLSITGNNSGIASAATGLTVSPNVVFGSGTYIACNSTSGGGPITFNGNVTLPTGTVSLWDAGHTFAGTTTFNGNFTNGGDQTLTLGSVTVAANTTLSGKITFGGAISIGSGITLTTPASNMSFSSASLVGSGTLSLGATLSEALTLTSWTGTVVLPAVTSAPSGGFRLDWYGKSGSTVKIDKGFSAWLSTSTGDSYQVKPRLVINSDFTITGNNGGTWYNFAEISGTGTGTLNQSNNTSGFHILHLVDFSGKVNNNKNHQGTLTPFTVEKITLNSAPVAGQLLVESDTPDNIALSIDGAHGVFVGNTKQDIIIEKKTDGIYVAATKSTERVGNEDVTVLDTGSNTAIDGSSLSDSKVAISGTVTQISGVAAENLLLKVTYTDNGTQTAYYSGILALDNSGNVSLVGNATVNGVSVQPAPADLAPLAMVTAGVPKFTIKTIPGLWYKAKVGTAPNNCAFTGDSVQATGATTSIEVSNAFGANDRVKYYKIAVGASSASFQ